MFVYTSQLPYNLQLGQDRNFDTNTNDRPIGVGRNTGRGFNSRQPRSPLQPHLSPFGSLVRASNRRGVQYTQPHQPRRT